MEGKDLVMESLVEPKVSTRDEGGETFLDISFGPITFRYRVTKTSASSSEKEKEGNQQGDEPQEQEGGQKAPGQPDQGSSETQTSGSGSEEGEEPQDGEGSGSEDRERTGSGKHSGKDRGRGEKSRGGEEEESGEGEQSGERGKGGQDKQGDPGKGGEPGDESEPGDGGDGKTGDTERDAPGGDGPIGQNPEKSPSKGKPGPSGQSPVNPLDKYWKDPDLESGEDSEPRSKTPCPPGQDCGDGPGKEDPGKEDDDGDSRSVEIDPEELEKIFNRQQEEEDPFEVIFGPRETLSGATLNVDASKYFGVSYGEHQIRVYPLGQVTVSPERSNFSPNRKLTQAIRSFLEPLLKAPKTALDPGVQVLGSPVRRMSSQNTNLPSWKKPKVSFGALSTLEGFDFSKLVVVLDISGSMSKYDVYVSIATYFRTLSTLSPSLAKKPLQAILIIFADHVVVADLKGPPHSLAGKVVKVAFDERVVSLAGGGTSAPSVLFPKLKQIISRASSSPSRNNFINGMVPVVMVTDFFWPPISTRGDLRGFLRTKPFIGFSTSGTENEEASPRNVVVYNTILSMTPYGMILHYPGGINPVYLSPEAYRMVRGSKHASGLRLVELGRDVNHANQ